MKLTKTQVMVKEQLDITGKLSFDMGNLKGKARQADAALQLVRLMPDQYKEVRQDFRYFSVVKVA